MKDKQKCPFCDGKGEYCFPEGAAMDRSDGWYKCDVCNGTGIKKEESDNKACN